MKPNVSGSLRLNASGLKPSGRGRENSMNSVNGKRKKQRKGRKSSNGTSRMP